MQADLVLEELRVLHFDLKAIEGDWILHWAELEHRRLKAHPHLDALPPKGHPMQEGHTPNSSTLYGPNVQTHESIGAIPIQNTTTINIGSSQELLFGILLFHCCHGDLAALGM